VASLPDPKVAEQVLADYTSAPIDEKLRATLAVLRKMTLEHETLGADNVRAALDAGVSRRALFEAMHVAYLFNIYDRLADTMGWHVPDQASGYYQSATRMLLKRGYR
jgi:alkylhydroperoxidase family enzyme